MDYPFLANLSDWFITSRHIKAFTLESLRKIFKGNYNYTSLPEPCSDIGLSGFQCTLIWVKDSKVLSLYSKYSTAEFLHMTGLNLSLANGPGLLSKRISRIFRPFRYHSFFSPGDIDIVFSDLDEDLYDGLGFVSKSFISNHFPDLLEYGRFEVTLMHEHGQEKGHVLIDENLSSDFLFPLSGRKVEVSLTDKILVGLEPVKGKDHMRLDIQSLVNLHPFFSPEFLQTWLDDEATLFLHSISTGEVDQALSNLGIFDTPDKMDSFKRWWLGDYLSSGGKLMWFPGTVRAFGRQHIKRIFTDRRKLRFPIPGMRYYIAPDLQEQLTPQNHCMLRRANASLLVNSSDWKKIAGILGGADCDDAVWVLPFRDVSLGNRVLIWRSPNQVGEYILLKPAPGSDDFLHWPDLDASLLPPRIDEVMIQYDELKAFQVQAANGYSINAMMPAIWQAHINHGVLGGYCNVLLAAKALTGRLP
jgi:hypothetical protein